MENGECISVLFTERKRPRWANRNIYSNISLRNKLYSFNMICIKCHHFHEDVTSKCSRCLNLEKIRIRKIIDEKIKCPHCGKDLDTDRFVCSSCLIDRKDRDHRRKRKRIENNKCVECGAPLSEERIEKGTKRCVNCCERRIREKGNIYETYNREATYRL